MNTELSQFLRLSPYQRQNILKFCPSALLPEDGLFNEIEIKQQSTSLNSFINYNKFQAEQPTQFIE